MEYWNLLLLLKSDFKINNGVLNKNNNIIRLLYALVRHLLEYDAVVRDSSAAVGSRQF
jgi:hypothetical protein